MLTVSQFKRFMEVIKKLGDRVEKEHDQYLRDSQRVEDRSAVNSSANIPTGPTGAVDFESLVGNSGGAPVKANSTGDTAKTPSWEDDVWGSILAPGAETPRTASPAPAAPVLSSVRAHYTNDSSILNRRGYYLHPFFRLW